SQKAEIPRFPPATTATATDHGSSSKTKHKPGPKCYPSPRSKLLPKSQAVHGKVVPFQRTDLTLRRMPVNRRPHYNRPMFFSKDRRRRAVSLLSLGVVLFFALLGALQWFNTSGISFLNPETAGETLAFTGLTVVLFL